MNTRYHCPNCNHRIKTFSRYIDTESDTHIHSSVGKCNREIKCGYHYTPKQYFEDNSTEFHPQKPYSTVTVKPPLKPDSYIDIDLFQASLKHHQKNNFIIFLINKFGVEKAKELIKKYCIGTSKHWRGANVFWQIDTSGKIRTGKIMLYNPGTGKRVKEPFCHINWVHSLLKKDDFNLRQCFFGEHLLNNNNLPVAIVESEKTAIICSIYLPQFIWLAVGSLNYLNEKKCMILKGRMVTLFPDLKAFDLWVQKAHELNHIASFNVSDLLEQKASGDEKEKGLDLADYLIRFDPLDFTSIFDKSKNHPKLNSVNLKTIQAYTDDSGKLYIPTPFSSTYTVYPSIEHYNKRVCLPYFEEQSKLNLIKASKVFIETDSLSIILNN